VEHEAVSWLQTTERVVVAPWTVNAGCFVLYRVASVRKWSGQSGNQRYHPENKSTTLPDNVVSGNFGWTADCEKTA